MNALRTIALLGLVTCCGGKEKARLSESGGAPPPAVAVPQQGPPVAPVPAPQPTGEPLTTAQRASMMGGLRQLQALVNKRQGLRLESEDACLARQQRDATRLKAAATQLGVERWQRRTPYQTVESDVSMCLACSNPEDEAALKGNVVDWCGRATRELAEVAAELTPAK